MLVVVNPSADGGRARAHWERIRPAMVQRVGTFEVCIAPSVQAVRTHVATALGRGEKRFVAVGGDGTVNLIIDLLVELSPPASRDRITVGAVGLGSSNDFHKRGRPPSTIGGFPCCLDFGRSVGHDIGRTTYVDERGERRARHWVINASVGTTAQANRIYNEARGLVAAAKRCSSSLGMVVAALQALFMSSGQCMVLVREDGQETRLRVRNIGVVKNPHFTGRLRYDSPYEPWSGDFFVHVLADCSLWDTVVTVARLTRGRFRGRRTARSWRGRWLALYAPRPFAVEHDGEIVVARRAEFSVEPRGLQVCT